MGLGAIERSIALDRLLAAEPLETFVVQVGNQMIR